ncbi:hypothetical protein VIGAN_02308200, partial [Vigna angularis var. angularis]
FFLSQSKLVQASSSQPTLQKSSATETKGERKRKVGSKPRRRRMWHMFVLDEEQKELGRRQAPGSCPYCDGKVEAMDVEIQWKFCFLPMCFKIKRKFFCTSCARRLELFF